MTRTSYPSTWEEKESMLKVNSVSSGYNHTIVLRDISLHIDQGEMITLIGPNGAGKTTLLMTLSGIIRPKCGTIEFMGSRIDGLPAHIIVGLGISHVPQGALLFPEMTVLENLELGAWTCVKSGAMEIKRKLQEVYSYFDVLRQRRNQRAGTLSGGEQQMLAIARALMTNPKLLLMDEPSAGVAPIVVDQLADIIVKLHETGLSILLVEQNADLALDLADRGYVLESGNIVFEDKVERLRDDDRIKRSYLGI
jgi:branched-chain amino acid transport system ATP-binding protein